MGFLALACACDMWTSAVMSTVRQPTYFPAHPIPKEMMVGAQVAKRRSASLQSLYMGDRANIGFWYDGMMSRDVEHAIWLSPALVSRILGFLERRELWEPGEAQRRWDALRWELEGRLTFVVELCAFKKVSMAELTPEIAADPNEILRVKFAVEIGENTRRPLHIDLADQSKDRDIDASMSASAPLARLVNQTLETKATRLGAWQVRDRKTLLRFRWWLSTPLGDLLTPQAESDPYDPLYPLGEYFGAWYLVQSVAPPGVYYSPRFKLKIHSSLKERVASFWQVRFPAAMKMN